MDKRKQAKLMKNAMQSIKKADIQQAVNNVINSYTEAIGTIFAQFGRALELAGKEIGEAGNRILKK